MSKRYHRTNRYYMPFVFTPFPKSEAAFFLSRLRLTSPLYGKDKSVLLILNIKF